MLRLQVPKSEILTFSVKNCKKPAVKHSIEKPISRNFVNLSTTFCPRLQFVLISSYEDGITKDESTKFHHFFISNTFINNARLKLAKKINQILRCILRVNSYYLKIIHILYPCYYPIIIGHILKNKEKNRCVCFHKLKRLIILKMEMNMKNRPQIRRKYTYNHSQNI